MPESDRLVDAAAASIAAARRFTEALDDGLVPEDDYVNVEDVEVCSRPDVAGGNCLTVLRDGLCPNEQWHDPDRRWHPLPDEDEPF